MAAREAAKSHPVPGPLLMAWVVLSGVCSVGGVPGGHQEGQTWLDRALMGGSCQLAGAPIAGSKLVWAGFPCDGELRYSLALGEYFGISPSSREDAVCV